MSQALGAKPASLLVLLTVMWGLNQVAIKVALGGFPPMLQMGLRSAVAGGLVLLWCFARGVPVFRSGRRFGPGVLTGILFGMEFALVFFGLTMTTASRSVVFLNTAPFFVAVGAHFWLGDRISAAKAAGLALAFVGIVVAFLDGLSPGTLNTAAGDVLCILAAVFWGGTTLVVKGTSLREAPAEEILLYQLLVSAPLGFALSFLVGEAGIGPVTSIELLAFLYQGVVVAGASYLAWFWLVRTHSAPLLHAFTFIVPVSGVFFGAVLLGDPVGWRHGLALLLVAGGIYLVNRPAPVRRVVPPGA
ncbi:DMT family transporter [Afifella aestuarii]|uniref:DMT family transporter n=1 Tax=Afifella aestuarii TaxID=1909496 RepID=UPI000FE42050|nr:DMT family transporter [Afifella aestuarii]